MIDIETSNAIQAQMLDKMYMYRGMLTDILGYIEGTNRVTKSQIIFTIKRELMMNPEFEVLEHLPHGKVGLPPDAYKELKLNEPH